MKAKKMLQVCLVVRDIKKSIQSYQKILGVGPWQIETVTPKSFSELTLGGEVYKKPVKFLLAKAMLGDIELELAQPIEGPTVYDVFLREKGEGVHHIFIKEKMKDDMKEVLGSFEQEGIRVIQSGKGRTFECYYMDTEPKLGVVYEVGNV